MTNVFIKGTSRFRAPPKENTQEYYVKRSFNIFVLLHYAASAAMKVPGRVET